ncbi:hypothetical protein L1281_000081 [Neisseria sp. HSC-16F19]|nr:STM3941 family protein [Neisseria sp. HSC-16F19]MCP2039516.1 hypothetical protein [Neisseria sp. HSC-16F19]
MSATDIHADRRYLLLLLMCSLLLVAACALMTQMEGRARPLPAWLRWPIGISGILLFGSAGVMVLLRLLHRRPLYRLSTAGLYIDRGRMLLPWSDICFFHAQDISKQPMILVELYRPQAWLAQQTPLQRRLLALNHRLYGTPLILSARGLSISPAAFADLLQQYWRQAQVFRQPESVPTPFHKP